MTCRVTTALGFRGVLKNVSLQRWVYGFSRLGCSACLLLCRWLKCRQRRRSGSLSAYHVQMIPSTRPGRLILGDEKKRPIGDVHTSLLEVRFLGRKLGLAFELDELELGEGKTAIEAIKDAAGGDRHVLSVDLPLDEMQDAASTLADGPALLLEVRHPDTELRQSFCPMGFSTQRPAGRWSPTRLRYICVKVVGETPSCSTALKKPTRKMLKLS